MDSRGAESDISWDHGGPAPGASTPLSLDASTTVNPFPSPALASLLKREIPEARSYPDPYSDQARSCLGKKFSLRPDRIVTGGGATVLLYTMVRDRSVRRLLLFEPIFSEYARAARFAGIPVARIPPEVFLDLEGKEAPSPFTRLRWGIDPLSIRAIDILPGDLGVLVNPGNPTGQELSGEQVRRLGRTLAKAGGALLVDESFQEFIDNRSSVVSAAGEDGLAVLRSLTKITGFPGIRAGFLAGSPGPMERVRQSLGPWSTGRLEQVLLEWSTEQSASSDFGWREESKRELIRSLVRAGIPYLPGAGPFVFVEPGWSEPEGRLHGRSLLERGIRIRLATGFGPEEGGRFVRLGFEAFSKTGALVQALIKERAASEGC